MYKPKHMSSNNQCKWCKMRLGFGVHSLCKQWYIFRIKQKIDSLENYVIWLENLVDELEEEPA